MAGRKLIPLAPVAADAAAALRAGADAARSQAAATRTPPAFTKGQDLALAFQWSEADALQAIRVLEWAGELAEDDVLNQWGTIFTFRPRGTAEWLKERIDELLQALAKRVVVVEPAFDLPDERYPRGSVWGFWHLAEACHRNGVDFMLMEPDCIPLHGGWVEQLVTEWSQAKWPYIGFIEEAHPSGGYPRHMAGCGIYHHDVWRHMPTDALVKAFDVALADHVVPLAQQSARIFQKFGPTEPPRWHSVVDVDRVIPKEAAVFHRNKDGSLIRLLRERR